MTSTEPVSLPARFGAFVAPYHDPAGNPTLQLRRDLELAVLLDELGYDHRLLHQLFELGAHVLGVHRLCRLRIAIVAGTALREHVGVSR